jgi:hypothetical protein
MLGREIAQQTDNIALHHLENFWRVGLGEPRNCFRVKGLDILPQSLGLIIATQEVWAAIEFVVHGRSPN